MIHQAPAVVCPIDFSEPSLAALGYAMAIANHFGARLIVVTVDDPLLAAAGKAAGLEPSVAARTEAELRRFCAEVLDGETMALPVEYLVSSGKPGPEIIRAAQDNAADLIVMSSHGRSGPRKLFFGSTTERVLRETSIPVLATSDSRRIRAPLSEIGTRIHGVVAPVDFTEASRRQTHIASGIAVALGVPIVITHVLEPIFVPWSVRVALPGTDALRRADAEDRLQDLKSSLPGGARVETIVLSGDTSEEIVKLADTRNANLIVVGLHSSGLLGPRMGSVTYRVLCLTRAMVLALPPAPAPPPAPPGARREQSAARDTAATA